MIAAVDAMAAQSGLYPGMPVAQAQALVPDLTVVEARPEDDAAALRRLAGWCLRYAPLAAAAPPDGVWIDVTGSAHLQGGETRLLRDLVSRLLAQGFAARAAVADTPGAAHAMARFGGAGNHRRALRRTACRAGPVAAGGAAAAGADAGRAAPDGDRADRRAGRTAARASGPPLWRAGDDAAGSGVWPGGRGDRTRVPAGPDPGSADLRRAAADGGGLRHRHRPPDRDGLCRSGTVRWQGRAGWICCSSGWTAPSRRSASARRGRRATRGIWRGCCGNESSGSIPVWAWRRCGWWCRGWMRWCRCRRRRG